MRLALLAVMFTVVAAGGCTLDDVGIGDDGSDDMLEVATSDREMITWNLLPYDALTWNTLTTAPAASTALTDLPLSSATFGESGTSDGAMLLRTHSSTPQAKMFMLYLVGCALPPGSVVHWKSPFNATAHDFRGSLGLCPQWESGAPDLACQERVSACLLARNNGAGHSVRISLRGNGGDGQPLPVTQASYAEPYVTSNDLCPPSEPGCGLTLAPVGLCEPLSQVRVDVIPGASMLTAGASRASGPTPPPPPPPPPATLKLRICRGDMACTAQTAVASCERCAALSFACPMSGVYTAMMGMPGPSSTSLPNASLTSTAGLLPEHEGLVFGWREAAFFGNIFNVNKLGVRTRVRVSGTDISVGYVVGNKTYPSPADIPDGTAYVAYRDMFACQSDTWTQNEAAARFRVCSGIGSTKCAAVFAGNCSPRGGTPVEPYTAQGRCTSGDGGTVVGDGDYGKCSDPAGTLRDNALTTFLLDRCLAPGGDCPN